MTTANCNSTPLGKRLLALLLAIFASGLQAAHNGSSMVFKTLSQNEGLSQNTVNDMLQDSRGYLWLATESGLNRYDGVQVQNYQRQPAERHSLPGNFIWALAEDAGGDLWLATRGAGLVRWQRDSGHFQTVHKPGQLPGTRQTRSLLIDELGHIWLGTRSAGLLQLDAQGQLLHWYARPQGEALAATGSINALMRDQDGSLLAATDQGLFRVDQSEAVLEAINTPWPDADGPVGLSTLLRDGHGRLWLGSFDAGLLRVNADGSRQHFVPQEGSSNSLSGLDVRDLQLDSQGRLWIASQNGLNLYRPNSQDFAVFQRDNSDPYSLPDDRVMSLAQDATGLLWVGTRVAGAASWNPRSWNLGAYAPEELSGSVVLAFADAEQDQVWIGGFGAPLQRFDTDGHRRAVFAPEDGYPARGESPVTALLRDTQDRLWIGTFDAGLQIYTPGERQLKTLQRVRDESDTLPANGIMSLMQGRNGRIWVGSFGGGVATVNAKTLAVTRIKPERLGDLRATALVEDALEQIWIASDGDGLYRYRPGVDQLDHFPSDPAQQAGPGSDTVYALHHDENGRLWIGNADAGLQRIAPSELRSAAPRFELPALPQALPSQTIYGIRSDASGSLWLSTSRGLVQWQLRKERIQEYHRAQGLHGEELNFGSHHRAADGSLLFGGSGGFNRFDPEDLDQTLPPPQLIITSFEKFNRPARTGQASSDMQSIRLRHDDDVIGFSYALTDFSNPKDNRYSVLLEGFDRDWSPPSTYTRSTYTNLDPGDYTFRVRGRNSAGIWTQQSRDIAIQVQPAPWATPQALALYLFSGLMGTLLLYRWRIRVIQREARIEQLSFYDEITGLPNRELFLHRVSEGIGQASSRTLRLSIIVLQFGSVKHIQDSHGLRSSHDIHRRLATRLNQFLITDEGGPDTELARLNETEFAILIEPGKADFDGLFWTRRLLADVQKPLEFDGHQLFVPVRAGVAVFPLHGRTPEELLEHANTAARDKAQSSAEPISYYDKQMTVRARERLSLESDLRAALKNDELQLYLQGKFDPAGNLVGAEALSRWTHPTRGAISPGVFVPLAEESELIMDLDDWVLDQVCATLARWRQHNQLRIAVNVSAETFKSGRIFRALERNRAEQHLDAAMLEIEVTESVLVRDINSVADMLKRIKALGHSLSLDDFGTGYSSLTYLQRFPFDKLKIDQAFVRDMEFQADQQALCNAIVALAQSLHLQTVAEGIETRAQLELLKQLGCNQFQGFFLHRPQAVAAFEAQWLSGEAVPKNS